jgi:hypothetical protein
MNNKFNILTTIYYTNYIYKMKFIIRQLTKELIELLNADRSPLQTPAHQQQQSHPKQQGKF